MYPVAPSIPNAARKAEGEQRRGCEANFLDQLAPRRRFWRLTVPHSTARASATRPDTNNAPARVRRRCGPLLQRPHAVDASGATRYGRAGTRRGKLSARQSREVTQAGLAKDLTWQKLLLNALGI